MSTEAALIAACTATPRDTLPRLVYADWLDEQNDPRGEMIRVMEEMKRHEVCADEYQKLRPARSRLWKSLDTAWLEMMGYQKVYRPLFGTMPEKREHRWRLAEEFIDIWHGGLKEGDGYREEELDAAEQRLGCSLPAGLREWYQLMWHPQSWFGTPFAIEDVRLGGSGDLLFGYGGNWGTHAYIRKADLASSDPPLYGGPNSEMLSDSLSAFGLMMLVSGRHYPFLAGRVTCENADEVEPYLSRYHRTQLQQRHPADGEIRCLEGEDLILLWQEVGTIYFDIRCRTEEAYQEAVRQFGDRLPQQHYLSQPPSSSDWSSTDSGWTPDWI